MAKRKLTILIQPETLARVDSWLEEAKGMTLPAHLSAEEETTREYSIGDFGYWDAGPDLAIFYDDIYEQTVVPVIPLGKVEAGAELLANTSGTVTLELMETGSE